MRTILPITFLLFSLVSFSQEKTDERLYTSLKEAISTPQKVYRLSITDPNELLEINLIERFENLEYLSLRGDGLKEFPPQLFELKRLKVLDISGNKFVALPSDFGRLVSLEELYLDDEENLDFEQAMGVVAKLPALKVLSLRNDSLLVLPASITQIKSLQLLDLGGNNLQKLPESITKLEYLEELRLDNDSKLDFRSAFLILGGLPRLKVLHLEGNALVSLPETINKLRSLEKLYLNDNQLDVLELKRNELKRLMLVDLQENPIQTESTQYLERTGVRIKF